MSDNTPNSLLDLVANRQNVDRFRELLWEGTYAEYLDMVKADPAIARNAYQRLFDLVESYGTSEYTEYKKTIVRHAFFDDPFEEGRDGVFGIDIAVAVGVDGSRRRAERDGVILGRQRAKAERHRAGDIILDPRIGAECGGAGGSPRDRCLAAQRDAAISRCRRHGANRRTPRSRYRRDGAEC